MRTLALPATVLPGAFFSLPWGAGPHRLEVHRQSAEMGRFPSLFPCLKTLSASGWEALPLVEKESMATRPGTSKNDLQLRAVATAISPSAWASGWIDCTVGKEKDTVFAKRGSLGYHQEKGRDRLDARAVPTVWKAARNTSPVVPGAPATSPQHLLPDHHAGKIEIVLGGQELFSVFSRQPCFCAAQLDRLCTLAVRCGHWVDNFNA